MKDSTINDIAQRAEVAPRTVTVHFPAKEELLLDAEPFTLDRARGCGTTRHSNPAPPATAPTSGFMPRQVDLARRFCGGQAQPEKGEKR